MATLYNQVPSVSAVFSLYTSFSAITMLFRTILNEVVPERIREYVALRVVDFFSSYFQSNFTFVIEERWEFAENQTFRAAEVHLPTRLAGLSTSELLVGSSDLKNPEAWYFHLTYKEEFREKRQTNYFKYLAESAEKIMKHREDLEIFTYNKKDSCWESAIFDPSH
ncbi:hypothetical protein F2Q70_00027657 [Brassica cretica]|uniref:AAA-type ATPase N-terminal domain-containing protein n=1 Tax=Brassica cretica TaxID=69181 RepID=A0A8S9LH37_BRACR|nr:hypothetical protein F2Q70_00027657 [Brassica cretica]